MTTHRLAMLALALAAAAPAAAQNAHVSVVVGDMRVTLQVEGPDLPPVEGPHLLPVDPVPPHPGAHFAPGEAAKRPAPPPSGQGGMAYWLPAR